MRERDFLIVLICIYRWLHQFQKSDYTVGNLWIQVLVDYCWARERMGYGNIPSWMVPMMARATTNRVMGESES